MFSLLGRANALAFCEHIMLSVRITPGVPSSVAARLLRGCGGFYVYGVMRIPADLV
jgi:hypothetical protein